MSPAAMSFSNPVQSSVLSVSFVRAGGAVLRHTLIAASGHPEALDRATLKSSNTRTTGIDIDRSEWRSHPRTAGKA